MWVESRAAEPILPLDLFRNRTVAASIAATFLITFGFFGGIIFIPRWFQFVLGLVGDRVGLPDAAAHVGVGGQPDHLRPDRRAAGLYKWMTVGAMANAAIGLLLMTGLEADTPTTTVWLWMLWSAWIGSSFPVFTRSSSRARYRARCSAPLRAP